MQALDFFQSASVCKCFANIIFSKYNICLSKENRETRLTAIRLVLLHTITATFVSLNLIGCIIRVRTITKCQRNATLVAKVKLLTSAVGK